MNFDKDAKTRIFLFLLFFCSEGVRGHENASKFVEIKERTETLNPGVLIFPLCVCVGDGVGGPGKAEQGKGRCWRW